MGIQKVLFMALVCCALIHRVTPTGLILNVLKNTAQQTRCKLHRLSTKLIQHGHVLGDPCAGSDQSPDPPPSSTSKIESENIQVTSETYPSSLDIDVRMNQDEVTPSGWKVSTSPRLDVTEKIGVEIERSNYATVPPDGGKHVVNVPCNGKVATQDGCLEEV